MHIKVRGTKLVSLVHRYWHDVLIVVVLAMTIGLASYQGAQFINPVIFDWDTDNVWFQADLPRVYGNMVTRGSHHYRTKVHPLFSLIAFSLTFVLRRGLGFEPVIAVKIMIAAVASLWISMLFILLRLIGCHRFDAMLFSMLAAISASAIFWFVVPETYSFGSLSILLSLAIVALAQYLRLSPLWYMVVSALTLSFTVTNWMAGILATIVNHPWKRSLQITINAFCLVVVLWGVQKVLFPTAEFFLGDHFIGDREEAAYVLTPESGGPLHVVKSFVFHTMVMPTIEVVDKFDRPNWPIMSTQTSVLGSGSLWGVMASILWVILLSLGLWGLFSIREHLRLRLVLALTLLGQLALHTLYGDETFLYALHFGPLLVVLSALSTLTRARLVALISTGALILSAGLNNGLQFRKATEFFQSHGSPRFQVQTQIELRPDDPWPRGAGHVVLATPGSREVDKAYHEPGGSFSPAISSFGVSLWMTDGEGNLKATSDDIPLDEIDQQFIWTDGQNIPGILTETNDYQAFWSAAGPEGWLLKLKTESDLNTKLMVVIRSVGPAGGAIESLNWDGQGLLINDRWSVMIDPAPAAVHLGEEGAPGWRTDRSTITQWQGEYGWGYARFELGDGSDWQVVIKDSIPAPIAELSSAQARSALELDLPDERFTASLNAQVAHLMMGLVGRQTRPGDPTNYPLAWQRDGAYAIVALARAGQLEVAKELSIYMAENDFFGGFGSEADAPGLAIWALEETATRLNQPEYDQWLWPHVHRKAELILKMISTDQPIHWPVTSPIVPSLINDPDLTLVAEPAQDGLIIGRMDNRRPLLFINAVSYRGLLDAASLADRVNQPAYAEYWRAQAAELKQAWEKAFQPPESENDRTYISGLWPTWVATSNSALYLQGLQERWDQRRDPQGWFRDMPLWTYFDVAEAHQWLFLNQQNQTWTTLRWFWDHQASPGLYTWWEGNGEENSFRRWEQVRGWVSPPHVTPHYWTAAEMLLLQLDMLAYTDKAASEPAVVIGTGIPAEWLDQPLRVRGLSMPNGQLDWSWDGKQMHVKMYGSKVKVHPGLAFSSDIPLRIEYLPMKH